MGWDLMAENAEAPKAEKNKKINHMTASELEAALKKTEEHMKGHTSRYAKALLARQAHLSAT